MKLHTLQILSLGVFGFALSHSANAIVGLDGTYQTNCLKSDQQGYEQETDTYAGTNLTITETQSSDAACASPLVTATVTGTTQEGAESQAVTGARDIDFVLSTVSLTVSNAQYIPTLNSMKLCGFSDWAAGVAKDVTGLSCNNQQMPKAGDANYDIYKLSADGSQLMEGLKTTDLDGSTPEKRPQALDTNRVLNRK